MFGFFKKKKADSIEVGHNSNLSGVSAISLAKDVRDTQQGVVLKKSCYNLDKSLISLEKKTSFNLMKHTARVFVALDYSGSMSRFYRDGTVQTILSTLMPLALQFDDNGELDVWLFDDGKRRIKGMTLKNFDSYVDNEILAHNWVMRCTSYAPVIKDMLNEHGKSTVPTFVLFITDGANNDKVATDEIIRVSANENVFIQFVGVGNDTFEYLHKLDDLKGRLVDNTGFIQMSDIQDIVNRDDLFELLLDQYPDWLKEKGLKW